MYILPEATSLWIQYGLRVLNPYGDTYSPTPCMENPSSYKLRYSKFTWLGFDIKVHMYVTVFEGLKN